jgi:hypothetical protein
MLATAVQTVKEETKTCVQCGETKPIDMFEVNRRKCKECLKKQRKEIAERKKADKEKEEPEPYNIENEIPKEINIKTKPKKETKQDEKIKKVQDETFKENIKMFLSIGFNFVANRAGNHWNISEQEAEQIATPLNNIVSKLSYVEQIAQNMDYVNLASALVGTIAPRAIQTIQMKKEAEKNGLIKPKNVERSDKGNDTNRSDTKEQNKTSSNRTSQNYEEQLLNEQLMQDIL